MDVNISGELSQKASPVKKGTTTQNIGGDDKPRTQKKESIAESKTAINNTGGTNSPGKVDIKV